MPFNRVRGFRSFPFSRLATFLGLFTVFAFAPRTFATTDSERTARKLLDEGFALSEAGDHRAALDKFRAAYQAFPHAKILFNLGAAFLNLARDAEAAQAFDRFLVEAPLTGSDVQKRRERASQLLGEMRARLGRVRILIEPVGAAIVVNGSRPETWSRGRILFVTPGRHRIEARAAGYVTSGQDIEVSANEEMIVEIKLRKAAVVAPPVRATVRSRRWTWVAAGMAGATLATGLVLGVRASAGYDEMRTTSSPERFRELKSLVGDEGTAANVLFAIGGAAVVASVVLFFLERQGTVVVPAAPNSDGRSTLGVTVFGRF